MNIEQLEAYRTALTGHCYRMLGSITDAEDAVQDTMIRAWKSGDSFDGRSSLKTWLYRIATNVCLDMLATRKQRIRPMEDGSACSVNDPLTKRSSTEWIEPIADIQAIPSDEDPSTIAILRQSIRLAFIAALQHLPPRQRAALLFTEVLGWSVNEVAETLDTTVPAINSALQRARSTLSAHRNEDLLRPREADLSLLNKYVEAFQRYDIDSLTSLLHHDATLSMPPYTLWFQGHQSIRDWLLGRGSVCRGSRLIPVEASGLPAFAQYHPDPEGGFSAWALIVLEIEDNRIRAWNSFMDTETHFPRLKLPMKLPA